MISKACVTGPYQRKLEEIAALDNIDLRVVVPPYWRTDDHREPLVRQHLDGYELAVRTAVFNGHFHYHFYPALGREIADFAPDLVHVDEEPYNLATAHAVWLARRHSARAVFFSWQNLNKTYPRPFSWMERYCYGRAAAIAGTNGAKKVLRAKGFQGPIEVIPQFGVDPEVFRPAPARGRPDHFTVGYLGRLVEEKGLRTLMSAMTDLSDARLRIGGRGPMAGWIREFAQERDMIDRVEGPTAVIPSEVPRFLNSLDVLVLPSVPTPGWSEQFGRVLVEAMACQVPVVASDSGEIPAVLGGTGRLVPPGDENALIEALEEFRSNPDLAEEMGRLGRKRVMENFTHRQIARATGAYYLKLLTGAGDADASPLPS